MSLETSLGDILHISLGEQVNCFGRTKIPGDTRPCNHELGKQRLSQARLILVQNVAQLERDGGSIEISLDQLSKLLVQERRHGAAGETRRQELKSEWRGLVQDFHRAQSEPIVPSPDLSQVESYIDGSSSEIEPLEEETAAPGSSTQDNTPTPAALHPSSIHHVTVPYLTPIPDDASAHSETAQWRIGQEVGCRGPTALCEVTEPLCDRSDIRSNYSSATTGTVVVNDVCTTYVLNLLFRFRFIFQILVRARPGTISFDSLWSIKLNIIEPNTVSTRFPAFYIFMIPFLYLLVCLARIVLNCNVVLIIGGVFFATGWKGRNSGWWPIQPRN